MGKDYRAVSAFLRYKWGLTSPHNVGRVIPYKICGSKYSTITNLAGNFYHLQYTIYTIRLQYPIFVRIVLLYTKCNFPPSSRCFPYSVPPLHFVWGNPRNRSAGGHTRCSHNRDISLIMSLRFVRQLRNNTAQSLVLIVKLDARCGRRPAPPALNKHIPLISTPWISSHSDKAPPSEINN